MKLIATTDTFDSTIEHLKQTLEDFGPLVTPIDDITQLVSVIDDLLVTIGDVITAANDIDDVILVLGEVLEFLDPIPIVGEVAEVISVAVETVGEALKDALVAAQDINREAIQPVATTLTDVNKGLGEVRTVIVDISQKVPGYLNTVEILSYLTEIAEPLSEVLKGSDAADKLHTLLDDFLAVQEALGTALSKFNPVITAVDTGVKELTAILNALHEAMGGAAGTVLNDIKTAATALTPISDGFHRMEHAIKPVAWVLEAASCVFNKILKPVIDAIMHVTHLDALVKSAEEEIFKKLGISPLMDMAGEHVDQSGVTEAGSSTGSEQGEASHRLWSAVSTALGQYRSGDDSATKAAILSLVSALTNTPIDPNKPAKAPPFPPVLPDLRTANTNMSVGIAVALYVPRRIVRFHPEALHRLQHPPIRAYTSSLKVLMAQHGALAADPLPPIDPKVWPNASALVDEVATLTDTLDTLVPAAAKLEGTLAQFESSLSLPATFSHQVTDLDGLFADVTRLLQFFDRLKLDFVHQIVQPLSQIAHDQQDKLQMVVEGLPALQTAVSDLDTSAEEVITNIPQTKVIDQTVHRIEGWSLSVNQLVQLVAEGERLNESKQAGQEAQLAAFSQQLEQIVGTVLLRVGKIVDLAATLTAAVNTLQHGLDTYASALQEISDHSTLLADKALPAADQALHVLNIIDSIIDPLSNLLEAEQCIDSDHAMKKYAANARDAINEAGKVAAEKHPQAIEQLAAQLADKALPLNELAQTVSSATTAITTITVAAFQQQSARLVAGLQQLSEQLTHTESYTTTITTREGKTKTITVNNDLFNQQLLADANAIIDALNANN